MVITADSHTTVVLSRDVDEPECDVCSVDVTTRDCSLTTKTLTNVKNVSLEFSCTNPEKMYSVTIERNIGELVLRKSPALLHELILLFKILIKYSECISFSHTHSIVFDTQRAPTACALRLQQRWIKTSSVTLNDP